MKSTTVHVISGGNPSPNNKVSIYVYQFIASGFYGDSKYTNSNGEAHFNMDIDGGAEIAVWVNGSERKGRGPVDSDYWISI